MDVDRGPVRVGVLVADRVRERVCNGAGGRREKNRRRGDDLNLSPAGTCRGPAGDMERIAVAIRRRCNWCAGCRIRGLTIIAGQANASAAA